MLEKGGVAGTQAGGVIAVIGGLTLNEQLALGGFALAVFSFIFQVCVTVFYKERHYRLARIRLDAELEHRIGEISDEGQNRRDEGDDA